MFTFIDFILGVGGGGGATRGKSSFVYHILMEWR